MPGMIELGEQILLKPVRRGTARSIPAHWPTWWPSPAATVMGLLEEARLARLRGFKVVQRAAL